MQESDHLPLRSASRAAGPASTVASRRPLYRRIADDLIEDIRRGVYPVGQALPTELELASRLGVSRGSVREALQILADAGLVERARKLGTCVLRSQPNASYVQQLSNMNDALNFGGDTLLRIDDLCDVAHPDEPLLDAVSPTGFWLQVTGVRHLPEDPVPTTWARMYVNGLYAGVRPLLRPEVASVYELIEDAFRLKVTRLRHKVTAIAAPAQAAKALGLVPGAPALQVVAWLHSENGVLVEFVRSIHDPARFSIELAAHRAGPQF